MDKETLKLRMDALVLKLKDNAKRAEGAKLMSDYLLKEAIDLTEEIGKSTAIGKENP